MTSTVRSASADETSAIAERFARELRTGDSVSLIGTLGAGKTHFVKGVCRYFGVQEVVTSPTFVLMHRYEGRFPEGDGVQVHHFDFYRIRTREELRDIGFRDLAGGRAISLIEWGDLYRDDLPAPRYEVRFELGEAPDERVITFGKVAEPVR